MRFFSFRILPREECAMTDEELRKLKRADLLELLVAQGKENEALQEKLRQAEAALWDRQIQLDEAGNIAEAALRLSGVFEAAQKASDQYLESIRKKHEETESRCARMEETSRARAEQLEQESKAQAERLEQESKAQAERLVAEAEEKARALTAETEAKCRAMVAQAEAETREFWDMVSQRLEHFYAEHAGLRELLSLDKLNGGAHENADG